MEIDEFQFLAFLHSKPEVEGKVITEFVDLNKLGLHYIALEARTNSSRYNDDQKIKTCTFKKGIEWGDMAKLEKVEFYQCVFESIEGILFKTFNTNKKISFYGCTFYGDLKFKDVDLDNVIFIGCDFKQPIEFSFEESKLKKLEIKENKSKDVFLSLVDNSKCYFGELYLTGLSFSVLDLNGHIPEFLLFSSVCANFDFNCHYLNFQISSSGIYDNSVIGKLNFHNPTPTLKSSIRINNTEIHRIIMPNFYEDVAINFLNVKFISEVNFANSIYNSLTFTNIYFHPNAEINFSHSDISKVVFAGVIWPKNYLVKSDNQLFWKKTRDELILLKDTYRQLKWVNKNQSNNIDAANFYKNELRIYWTLTWKYGWNWKSPLKTINNKFQEFLIVGSNYLFSKFGQSIARPLIWLFTVHFFLFYFLYTKKLQESFYFEWFGEIDWNYWGKYLTYLSPVHKIPGPFENDGSFLVLDFFIRFFSGYFIYHVIKASRKYAGN